MLVSIGLVLATGVWGQTSSVVQAKLEAIRLEHHIPGLWVAASVDDKQVFSVALGRKWARGEPASLTDALGVGSISKYFLADLATLCVLKGEIEWETRVSDVFSDCMGSSPPPCMSATMHQLIIHEGGFPRDHIPWLDDPNSPDSRRQWRKRQIRTFTGVESMDSRGYKSPTLGESPGSRMTYSNFGASVVGSMLERKSGIALDTLFETRLFKPFGLASAGMGLPNPGAASKVLPIGHFGQGPDGKWQAFTNWNDNPEPRSMAAAASGGLRMTITDLVKYLTAKCNFRVAKASPLSREAMGWLWNAGMDQDTSSGAVGGYRAWFKMDRKRHLVVAYICNANLTEPQTKELESYLSSL